MRASESVAPAQLISSRAPTTTQAPVELPRPRERIADRITDVAVRGRFLYVKIGYFGEPDNEEDPSWYFFKDLAEPEKRTWLRSFVHDNVAGIRDSGWKSLPGLLAEAGAPLPSRRKPLPVPKERPAEVRLTLDAGGDCNARSDSPLLSGESDGAPSPRTGQ
jgi:hypothetical protein